MNWKPIIFYPILSFSMLVLLFLTIIPGEDARTAEEWQQEEWMQTDTSLAEIPPGRLLSLTDLPLLDPYPEQEDYVEAIRKSTNVGCNAAVLSFSWPSLEPSSGVFTLGELKRTVLLNEGRYLYLGIQVLNTTVKDLPKDLQNLRFDDPVLLRRFTDFLDGLALILKNRITYLSIGNEIDIYLAAHPEEFESYTYFLEAVYRHVKQVVPNLIVSTTLTDKGVINPDFQKLMRNMDAYFLTYYHGQHGTNSRFKETSKTKDEIIKLISKLDERPVIFQEIGFPADSLTGSPQEQAEFVKGVFDAWDELGGRISMLNYFMLYDFPKSFIKEKTGYYEVSEDVKTFKSFLGSLGLHDSHGFPRPAWDIFKLRAKKLQRIQVVE